MVSFFKTINSLENVLDFIENNQVKNDSILLVVDMDLTLTMPPLESLAYLLMPVYRATLNNLLKPLDALQKQQVMKLGLQLSQHQLIEQQAPSIIKKIQNQHIKTIVLTAQLTGQVNDTIPIELQRFQKLSSLDIHLEEEKLEPITLQTKSHKKYPLYYKGILCTYGSPGTNTKGPALASYLTYTNFLPKKIIMVDDKKQYLENVYQSINETCPDLEFIGLEYLGAQVYLKNHVDKLSFEGYWNQLIQNTLTPSLA